MLEGREKDSMEKGSLHTEVYMNATQTCPSGARLFGLEYMGIVINHAISG